MHQKLNNSTLENHYHKLESSVSSLHKDINHNNTFNLENDNIEIQNPLEEI
jgi:hypothetical protein